MGISLIEVGRCIAAARQLAGYRTAQALCDAIREQYDLQISASSIYAYEAGRTEAPFSIVYAIIGVCNPPGGLDFFARARTSGISDTVTGESRFDSRRSSSVSKEAAAANGNIGEHSRVFLNARARPAA